MRAQNDLGVVTYQVIDGLHSLVDTLGIGDIAVFIQRNVEIAADQNFFPGYVDIFHCFFL